MACPTAQRVGTCGATIASLCPLRPFRTGSRLGGKKAQVRMDTDFLDWALADFSGYVAADELYDGPFCILSAVDNRRYKRILYDVLDHDPTHDDIRAFLRRLHTALAVRDLTLFGVTTDGSALSPTPLGEVFGEGALREQPAHPGLSAASAAGLRASQCRSLTLVGVALELSEEGFPVH